MLGIHMTNKFAEVDRRNNGWKYMIQNYKVLVNNEEKVEDRKLKVIKKDYNYSNDDNG